MEDHTVKTISTLMSAVTIASCLFLKVPQIMTVTSRKSADGINLQAMVMEVTGFTIMTLYNYINEYSIMTYLEYPIILVQVYVLFYFVLLYRRMLDQPLVRTAIWMYILLCVAFLIGYFPPITLAYMVPFCTPLSGFAKVSYIYGIVSTSNADSISLTTWIISIATNLSRIFTVYVDSGDLKLMFNFLVSSVLSAGVLLTAIFYKSFGTTPATPQPTAGRRKRSARQYSSDSSHED